MQLKEVLIKLVIEDHVYALNVRGGLKCLDATVREKRGINVYPVDVFYLDIHLDKKC